MVNSFSTVVFPLYWLVRNPLLHSLIVLSYNANSFVILEIKTVEYVRQRDASLVDAHIVGAQVEALVLRCLAA